MTPRIPPRLAASCRDASTRAWLARLPDALREVEQRWSLAVGAPFEHDETACAWVAPAMCGGTPAVLKLAMPHMEGEHEIAGLRFWNGDPTVRLLEADEGLGAMLLERCVPGTSLRELAEPEQDRVVAPLLRRLWRVPPPGHRFRPLSAMIAAWSEETRGQIARWPDAGLVNAGLRAFSELTRGADAGVLLATDLHAGNVLRAQRAAWLAIDPKPFVGDPAYDATQHLLNCRASLRADPRGAIHRFADVLGVDRDRVRLWTFARAAAAPRDDWRDGWSTALARAIE